MMAFHRDGRRIAFGSRLDIGARLKDTDPAALAVFLRDPTQIICASWPRERTMALPGAGDFRLVQLPISFAGAATIDFHVDVHLDVDPRDGRVTLRSYAVDTSVSLRGGSKTKVIVDLELQGELRPIAAASRTTEEAEIAGFVAYETSGSLQGPLVLLPDAALRAATEAINHTVLLFARRDFVRGIKRNFDAWYAEPGRKAEVAVLLKDEAKVAEAAAVALEEAAVAWEAPISSESV